MYYEKTITAPSDVMEAISRFLVASGWSSYDSFNRGNVIGYPFTKDDFCVIFAEADSNNEELGKMFAGNSDRYKLVMTGADSYDEGSDFDQLNILKDTAGNLQGVGISRYCGSDVEENKTELRCISNTDNGETYTFCLTTYNREEIGIGKGDYYDSSLKKDIIVKKYCQYLSISKIVPISGIGGKWIITGTYHSSSVPKPTITMNDDDTEKAEMSIASFESGHKPLYSTNSVGTTFCRIGIDAAEIERGITWASGCPSSSGNYTGKALSTSITESGFSNMPLVPYIGYLQSTSNTDFGRDTNTLNCVSTNLPIAVFVLRDPDLLNNYSQIGYIGGIFFVSLRNMAPLKKYEVSSPGSGLFYQVFPMCVRGGKHGYDGMSIPRASDETILE